MERWKPIPGTAYEASSLGKIRGPNGVIQGHPDSRGYVHYRLYCGSGGIGATGHALVMQAFVGPCPHGMEIRHKDGSTNNNRLSNLAYGTHSENVCDSFRHGRRKLDPQQVREIRKRRAEGESGLRLAAEFGVSNPFIYMIANRRAYWWVE